MKDLISTSLNTVRDAIGQAAASAGRSVDDIELIAVSKTHPPDAVEAALDAGQLLFGESRVQEARVKIPQISGRARWHFIGHLQKNKIRHALPLFEMLHGVDSIDGAADIARIAGEMGVFPRILLEVNVAGESSKFGFRPDVLRERIDDLMALDRVQIEGLMTIAPLAPEAEASRRHFAALRELRDELQTTAGISLPHLSMGMSSDYLVAIEEGATLVRVGTAIFGRRATAKRRLQSGADFLD